MSVILLVADFANLRLVRQEGGRSVEARRCLGNQRRFNVTFADRDRVCDLAAHIGLMRVVA